MSVFGVMYKMGYFRENLHTKQKTSRKNPSTSFAGPPPLKGELAPQVTEGLSCKSFTSSKRFHGVPLHQLRWSPPPKGEAYFRLP